MNMDQTIASNTRPEMPVVKLSGAVKTYGQLNAIDNVDLEIRPRELFTLLGPSGSGKSTVLRAIAGLVSIDGGEILIDGEDVRNVPTYKRNIGMVFQSLALFPHMSVFDNIAFPLRMRRMGRAQIAKRVAESLDVVRLHREIDVTIINVTHDQVEAMILSDRIGVMNEGKIVQVANGENLYRRPANRFVADFLGRANCIDGTYRSDSSSSQVVTPDGAILSVDKQFDAFDGGQASAIVRAEDITLCSQRPDDKTLTGIAGKVDLRLFEGEAVYYEVVVQGIKAPLRVASKSGEFAPGSEVWLAWPLERVWVVTGQSDA